MRVKRTEIFLRLRCVVCFLQVVERRRREQIFFDVERCCAEAKVGMHTSEGKETWMHGRLLKSYSGPDCISGRVAFLLFLF